MFPRKVGRKDDPIAADRQALGRQKRALERFAAAVAAEASAGRDDAVARYVGTPAASHDVADGARGARPARTRCDFAV
jgi:hypothetical protein